MIDEEKKREIQEEAKAILNRFAKAIEKVKIKKKNAKNGAGGCRKENYGNVCDEDFRKKMFENAPSKDGDCIVAEKKSW